MIKKKADTIMLKEEKKKKYFDVYANEYNSPNPFSTKY
jgi:hypothetical protein